LILVLLLAAAVYYALPVGMDYFRHYQLHETMLNQASFASSTTDQSIRSNILTRIEELDLPAEATNRLVVRRTVSPTTIIIETSYSVTFEFPFYAVTHKFEPSVRMRF
jgi:hypothetical protein